MIPPVRVKTCAWNILLAGEFKMLIPSITVSRFGATHICILKSFTLYSNTVGSGSKRHSLFWLKRLSQWFSTLVPRPIVATHYIPMTRAGLKPMQPMQPMRLRYNKHWHKRWKVKPVDADLLFVSEDSNSWPFNRSREKRYILHFLLGLYWTLNRVCLSGPSTKWWWVACNASCAKTFVGRCSEKICKLGLSRWEKRLVRQTLFSLCPQTFSFVMALMLALSKTVGSCVVTETTFNS